MELKKCDIWEERYNIFAKQFLVINTSLSPVNLKTLCTTVYKHSSAIVQYDLSTMSPIKSPIILLKATCPLYPMIEEDYDLHKVFLKSCANLYLISQIQQFFIYEV